MAHDKDSSCLLYAYYIVIFREFLKVPPFSGNCSERQVKSLEGGT